jgi:RimJ/RimL family protein N-acetyltransferase
MQHHGIGTELASSLVWAARSEQISNLVAWTSRDNHAMQRILERAGFTLDDSMEEATLSARLQLSK